MASKNASFEVQLMKDGRWSTQSFLESDQAAIAAAKRYLLDKKCEGARALSNWTRPDGKVIEKIIFEETRTVKDDGPIRLVQVDEAPVRCEAPEDIAGPQSRMLMNRLFRNYMEKAFVTPTEILHNYKELKRLQDKDTLLSSAVDRVAFLQTREGEQDARSRSDELFKNIDAISRRARRAETLKLPKLNGSLGAIYENVAALADGECDADFLARVVLSNDLVNARNWLGKLDRLCKLAVEEASPQALETLDHVIADVLGANVVQEILGWQPSLAAAIISMFDLAEGRMDGNLAGESTALLNQLFAGGKLPHARICLLDRAHRQLRSANPLYRSDATKELDGFRQVLERVALPQGFLAGAETTEALTARYGRMVEQGGAAGRRAAINATFRAMPDRAYGAVYLCNLAETDYAKDHLPDLAELFDMVLACRHIGELCLRSLGPKDRMLRATIAHRAALAAPLPEPLKKAVTGLVDDVLERYLIDEQIIEKLDHHESPLRDRAVRLVQFCAAGVLPEGKALTRARSRILALLRQPNFDARFVDGITDPVKAQKALRDFHQLLVRAGFGG